MVYKWLVGSIANITIMTLGIKQATEIVNLPDRLNVTNSLGRYLLDMCVVTGFTYLCSLEWKGKFYIEFTRKKNIE